MQSAVLLLVFNRPKHTARVFEAIRAARPTKLYVAGDGPRMCQEGDIESCDEVHSIVTRVDWPCELRTLFRKQNHGCKNGVASGINWFFDNEEQGIILEDDCVPHPDFFDFCDALLKRYADDERIWVITGDNFQNGRHRGEAAYYFSRYNHCWGWATWRRAWKHYRADIPFWSQWRRSRRWNESLSDPVERRYWTRIFSQVFRGKIDSWAYPWTACVWYHGGLTATPNANLVTNIGFGEEATHTRSGRYDTRVTSAALGELSHPLEVVRDADADRYTFENHFGGMDLRWPKRGIVIAKSAVRRVAQLYRNRNER